MTTRLIKTAASIAVLLGYFQALVAAPTSASSPATASAPSSASAPASDPAPFKLATYNINFGMTDDKSLAAIVKIINKASPDLLTVQETNEKSALYFRGSLSKIYPHMIFVDGPRAGGLAVLSRLPVEKHVLPPSNGGPFQTLVVKTKLGGRDVWVADIHLCPTTPPGNGGLRQYLQMFSQTDAVREKEIRFILQELAKLNKNKEPVLMMGDFNSPSQYLAPTAVTAEGLIDSFAAMNQLPDSQPTWQWNWQGTMYGFRLDYIFHSRQIRTLESSIMPGGPSDHFLVVSRLQWADIVAASQAAIAASSPSGEAATSPTSRANTPSGLPIPPLPGQKPEKIPPLPPRPAKTVDESLSSPEAMAAGMKSGLVKAQFLQKKITWKLSVQEPPAGGEAIVKACSSSGFLITCRVPAALAAQAGKLKADDAIEIEGTILNLEYDRPQETRDVFDAKIEMLGVLVDLSKLQKIEKSGK